MAQTHRPDLSDMQTEWRKLDPEIPLHLSRHAMVAARELVGPKSSGAGQPDQLSDRLLLDSITDYAIYMLDARGFVTSWNAGARRFKGYTAAEILGLHFSTFFTEADRQAGRPGASLATAARDGRFEAEGWRVRKGGAKFWAHVVIAPIRDSAGAIIGFAKITRDVTERKIASDTLRLREAQLASMMQRATDSALIMLDPDGRIADWNDAAERLTGHPSHEIIGKPAALLVPQADRPWTIIALADQTGHVQREQALLRRDESVFWASVNVEPIHQPCGTPAGFACCIHDISAARAREAELAKTREALIHTQKLEAVGRLSAGVAHDFNNILQSIIGALELATDAISDRATREHVDMAIDAAVRGASLTQQLLSYARKQILRPAKVDLQEGLPRIGRLLARTLGPNVSVNVGTTQGLAIKVDPGQFETAVINLAINAAHAMPDGGTLIIGAERCHDSWINVSVTDTGCGMDAATLAQATEPFFTTKGLKGSGLGLSMVLGFAEQSGGRMTMSSILGEGTRVDLHLLAAAD